MRRSRRAAAIALAMAWALTGCTTTKDTAVFVTKTSLGLDVQATPANASIGYDRLEGYFGPRYDSGTVPAVAGMFHTEGGLLDRKVNQTYATGTAAHALTRGTSPPANPTPEVFDGDRKPMFFGTNTVMGVRIGFGTNVVQDFTFGFRRQEMSSIPVATTATTVITGTGSTSTTVTNTFAPVFAHFDNMTVPKTTTSSTFAVTQLFATGRAAEQLAADVRPEFLDTARKTVVSEYRDSERIQKNSALRALHCVSKLPDSRLPAVWDNAKALGLFDDPGLDARLRAAGPHDARAIYTGQLGILDFGSRDTTTRLAAHEQSVCK